MRRLKYYDVFRIRGLDGVRTILVWEHRPREALKQSLRQTGYLF